MLPPLAAEGSVDPHQSFRAFMVGQDERGARADKVSVERNGGSESWGH